MENISAPKNIRCGYFDCTEFGSLKKSPLRTAGCYEIEYFLEDGKSTYLNGLEISIKADRILITKPDDRRYSVLPFKTVYLKFTADGALRDLLNCQPVFFDALHKNQLRLLFHELIVLSESQKKDPLLFFGKLFTLLSFIIKDGEHKKRGTNYSYAVMHSAKKFIENNYKAKISTADIAKSVHLSESRFRYLFGVAYGLSPHAYLTETRISAAKEMLWNSDTPLTLIAEKCGFGCQQYLNDTFKKSTGISPGTYRAQFSKKYTE